MSARAICERITRAFKIATGMTPREFRRLHRPALLMAAE